MKNNKQARQDFPIPALREELRGQAMTLATRLSRSVGRLTSCDDLPCVEYGQEVKTEYDLAERLLYIQQCRNALEQCIASGASRLNYRWGNGERTVTRFRKIGPNRVQTGGLQKSLAFSVDCGKMNATE